MAKSPQSLSTADMASLEKTFRNEYIRRTQEGEKGPFAALMAARQHQIEYNKLLARRSSRPAGA